MSLYSEETLEIACLGRPMEVGMLYDCRNEHIIPGVTLWNKSTLQDHTVLNRTDTSEFEVITEDSLDKKAHSLGIDASVKLSFLGGLISINGSAKYLDNKKTSHRQARVTLSYKCSTFFERMSMDQLAIENIQYKDVFDKGTATHVITGVEYGANAIFVFDRQLHSNEDIRNVEGFLKVAIDKIPYISVDGGAQLKLTEEEQHERNKFRCTFHGDLILPMNPTTFDDAVNVYRDLPKLIRETSSNNGQVYGRPKKVYLYPLSKLDTTAARLVRMISDSLVNETQTILETINSFQATAKDLTKGTICERFPGIHMQITRFMDLVSRFVTNIQRKLLSTLPKIRGGEEEEEVLADTISDFKRSPFNSLKLETWLEAKIEEANILDQFLRQLANNCIFASEAGNFEQHVHDTSVEHALAMSFGPITNISHPFLEKLEEYLGNPQTTSQFDESTEEHWFHDDELVNQLRKQLGLFSQYAQASKENKGLRFILLSRKHRKNAKKLVGAITLYTDGSPKAFQLPSSPGCPELVSFDDKREIQIKWDGPKEGSEHVVNYSVEYRAVHDADLPQNWHEVLSESDDLSLKISDLQPETPYVFKVASICEAGKSKYSKLSKPFSTVGPVNNLQIPSPPGRPYSREKSVPFNRIRLAWKKPERHPEVVKKYHIAYRLLDAPNVTKNWSYSESETTQCSISELVPHTNYVLKVAAASAGGRSEYSSLSNPILTGVRCDESFSQILYCYAKNK